MKVDVIRRELQSILAKLDISNDAKHLFEILDYVISTESDKKNLCTSQSMRYNSLKGQLNILKSEEIQIEYKKMTNYIIEEIVSDLKAEDINSEFNEQVFLDKQKVLINAIVPKKRTNIVLDAPKINIKFYGRDTELEEIDATLRTKEENGGKYLLFGEGGIGKTTLAAVYFHKYKYFYDNAIWFQVKQNNLSANIRALTDYVAIHALNIKNTENIENKTTEEKMEFIASVLRRLRGTKLIIIDNIVEDNWSDFETLIDTIPNVSLLLTSRKQLSNYGQKKLLPLIKEDAISLFFDYCKRFDVQRKTEIQELLNYIEYNTLLIELLAKLLNSTMLKVEPAELLKKLKKHKITDYTEQISGQNESVFEPRAIHQHLCVLFSVSSLKKEAVEILRLLSLLPNHNYIPYSFLLFLLDIEEKEEGKIKDILNYLSNQSWLKSEDLAYAEEKGFRCHPAIAESINLQYPPKRNYWIKLIRKIRELVVADYLEYVNISEKSAYLEYAQSILSYFDSVPSQFNKLVFLALPSFIRNQIFSGSNVKDVLAIENALGFTYYRYGNYEISYEYLERAIANIDIKLGKYVPIRGGLYCHLCLWYRGTGEVLRRKGDIEGCKAKWEKAKYYIDETLNIMEKSILFKLPLPLHKAYTKELVMWHMEAGILYSRLAKFYPEYKEIAPKYLNKGIEYAKSVDRDGPLMAFAYSQLGSCYTEMKEWQKVVEILSLSIQLFRKHSTKGEGDIDFAITLQNRAIAYFYLNQCSNAKDDINNAIRQIEKSVLAKEKKHDFYIQMHEHYKYIHSQCGQKQKFYASF